jgi:hypothetical protein
MSDLLNKASLVVIPSGYKEDTVYSVVPSDGSGDLSFTRASNGTRVNSAGLVEVCPWNLLQNSENFTSNWNPNSNTITANTTTAPNGTTTADTFTLIPSGDSSVYQAVNGESNNYTTSVYAKYVSGDKYLYFFSQLNSQGAKVWFDIQNGTVSNQLSGFTGTIENVGNGWYKCSMYNTTASISDYIQFGISTTNSSRTLSNNSVAYFWGAQVNVGTAKPYFPTTDRLNVPRLTYQNGGGGCPSLLLEKQSTNLALYSEALSTNPNIVDGSTATANVYVSPDGTQNAMQFTETVFNDRHGFYQYTTVTAQTYTASIFTKQTGRRYIAFSSDMANGTNVVSYFDLETKSVVSSGSGYTCSIQDFGNGWLRLIVTLTVSAGAAGSRYVIWGGSPDGTTTTYTGSTSISQTFWGYQFEASSYPTSYIPTTTASATRVEDVCNKTGVSSLIGQTEGVMFSDFNYKGNAKGSIQIYPFYIGQGTASNSVTIGLFEDALLCRVFVGGTPQNYFTSSTLSIGRHKVAFVYANNNLKLFLDGVLIQTDTSATIPTCDQIYIGASGTTVLTQLIEVNTNALWKTILTDAECIALTTL